jgi:hypothetical protein
MLPACIRDAMALSFSLSFALLNSTPHQETQKNPQPPLQTPTFAAMDRFLRGFFCEGFEENPVPEFVTSGVLMDRAKLDDP